MRLLIVCLICVSMIVSVWTQKATFKNKFTKRMREFSGEMYRTIVENDPGKNVIFSPLSIYHTLGMVNVGAGGNTKKEILKTMRLDMVEDRFNDQRINVRMSKLLTHTVKRKNETASYQMANALFLQENYPILTSFQRTLVSKYSAEVREVNFVNKDASVETINGWIADMTNGRIKNLVSNQNIQPTTRLILANAIYFKNKWEQTFAPAKPMNFRLRDGTKVRVKAMKLHHRFRSEILQEENMHLIAIPYTGKTSQHFVVGMPISTGAKALSAFTKNAAKILGHLKPVKDWPVFRTTLIMPKFKIELETDLKPVMKSLGISDLFQLGRSDLSRISGEELAVSDFLHKAFIRVNEKGTEAAAATSVASVSRAATGPTKINKPFFYGIFDEKANVFTFLGQITDPRNPSEEMEEQETRPRNPSEEMEEQETSTRNPSEEMEEQEISTRNPSEERVEQEGSG